MAEKIYIEPGTKTILQLPTDENIQVWEDINTYYWFDEWGILCSIKKKHQVQISLAEAVKIVDEYKKRTGNRPLVMLGDVTYSTLANKETRDYAAKELPNMVKAMGLVTASTMGRTMIRFFLALIPPTYPVKIFTNVDDARQWLKQYL